MSEPICREPDGVTPCRGESVCHESRRYQQAGYTRTSSGLWRQDRAPLRGPMCWAYDKLVWLEHRKRAAPADVPPAANGPEAA